MKVLYSFIIAFLLFDSAPTIAQKNTFKSVTSENPVRSDTVSGWIERFCLMPNIEVGKGITFRPRNDRFEVTMRFRMQNLLAMNFNNAWTLTGTDARVKRLRLRFDGYIYSPKLVYSIQLGFTGYDAEPLPNGNMNIVRDAIVYYVPSEVWNIGFGQTKIKANRARINSSSALQFVDRSIVNSQFNLDRDFGFSESTIFCAVTGSTLPPKPPLPPVRGATGAVRPTEGLPTRVAWSSIRWDASRPRARLSKATTNTRSA